MGILLNVRNEVAPGSHLCADVKELRDNREQKMRITKKVAKMSMVTGLIFVLTLNGGKFSSKDEHRPDDGNRPDNQIGLHDAQRFRSKVRFVRVTRLLSCDFLWRWRDYRSIDRNRIYFFRDRANATGNRSSTSASHARSVPSI